MNPSVVGKEYPPVTFTIDGERVAAFRNLFGEDRGVPVTFVTAAEFAVIPRIVDDPELGLDLSRVLHGNQEYELTRPLVEGETLQVRSRIESVRALGGNAFLVIATDLVGDDGRVACTARSTMIERSG
jgi:N-terminal half of MaoC dehydratase